MPPLRARVRGFKGSRVRGFEPLTAKSLKQPNEHNKHNKPNKLKRSLLIIPAAEKEPEQQQPDKDGSHQQIGNAFRMQQEIM
jgi:hypothetical protein